METKDKLRIMFYINTLRRGGAERVICTLANELTRKGHECMLVTSYKSDSGEYSYDTKVKRANLERANEHGGFASRNIRRVVRLRRICKVEKPDVLVSFMQEPILRALSATFRLPIRNVISIRNDPAIYWRNPVAKFAAAVLVPRSSCCVLQTEDAQRAFVERFGKVRTDVILNPVADSFFDVDKSNDEHLVVACGRLVEQKNHALLIKSFERVHAKHPDWRLSIYGEGPLKSKLGDLIAASELSGSVFLCGRVDDVASILSRASMFVLSSDFEGLPNALMEAMAAGVPCVSTDCPCGGPRSLIKDGVNGLLVPTGDAHAMAVAMDKLIACSELAEEMGANARCHAEAFSEGRVAEQWEKLLNRTFYEERVRK